MLLTGKTTPDRMLFKVLIQAQSIHKHFIHRLVLDGLNFNVQPAEFVALAGPNGAGKTTLLRLLAGLLKPNSGQIYLNDFKMDTTNPVQKKLIGFAGHYPLLYGDLTAEENLHYYARLYQVDDSQKRIDTVMSQLLLTPYRFERVGGFSRGMLQRLSIGRAWLHQPRLLLLDEPYSGLDIESAASLDGLLGEVIADGCAVVMTTHDFEHGLHLVDRLDVLCNGHISASLARNALSDTSPAEWYKQVLHDCTAAGGLV